MQTKIVKGEKVTYTTNDKTIYVSDDGIKESLYKEVIEEYEATKDIKHQRVDFESLEYGYDLYLVENEEQKKIFKKYFRVSIYADFDIPIGKWFLFKRDEDDYSSGSYIYSIEEVIEKTTNDLNILTSFLNTDMNK